MAMPTSLLSMRVNMAVLRAYRYQVRAQPDVDTGRRPADGAGETGGRVGTIAEASRFQPQPTPE
jgi:hypothetical protein